MNNPIRKYMITGFLLLINQNNLALDNAKYNGGPHDGHSQNTTLPNQILGYIDLAKYGGGSYDGHGRGMSPDNLVLGILNEAKYYGCSYDGYASAGTSSNQVLGFLCIAKYSGGLYDGHGRAELSNNLVQIKLFLEGPYSAPINQMATGLAIPTVSPYSEDLRTIGGVPSDIVDWVMVQLRIVPDGFTVACKSALLHKDGRIMADDGATDRISMGGGAGDRHIVVKHRNHLAAMSSSAQPMRSDGSTLFDFSSSIGQYYGVNGAKMVATGILGLWAGDVNQDKNITTSDYTSWYNSARLGESGYRLSDINMDGVVTTSDYTMWYNNARLGAASTVP